MKELEENGIVVDERKPDVVRVAPAPLYNTYSEVWEFVQIFWKCCENAAAKGRSSVGGGGGSGGENVMVDGGKDKGGWSEIK